jgi:hypothetical protein
MPETTQFMFPFKEITALLVKQQDIHEGFWGILFEFAFTGGGVAIPPAANAVIPAAIVGIPRIGIQRFDTENPLTVNAAEVNPAVEPASQ